MRLEKNNWYKQSISAILNLINSHKNKEVLIIRQEFSEISFFLYERRTYQSVQKLNFRSLT